MAGSHPPEYQQTLIKDISSRLTDAYKDPIATSDYAKTFLLTYLKQNLDEMNIVTLMNVPALLKVLGLSLDID